jgi:hypothetical protein
MIDARMQYQAIIFVNASDITPIPDTITALMDIFRDKVLVPNIFQELSATTGLAPQARLSLSSPNNEWNISFGTQRIVIEKNPTDPKGSNLAELGAFCSSASDFYERIVSRFKKRANRAALATSFLLSEMPDARLSAVYLRLFRPPEFYAQNPPFEWIWRSAARKAISLAQLSENLNVITTINRLQGTFGPGPLSFPLSGPKGSLGPKSLILPFDRLQLSFDINTSPDNSDYRFELPHIKTFYENILQFHDLLLKQVLEYING